MSQPLDGLQNTCVSRSITVCASGRTTIAAWRRFLPMMEGVQQLGQIGPAAAMSAKRTHGVVVKSGETASQIRGGIVDFRPVLQGRATEVRVLLAWHQVATDTSDWADSDVARALTRDLFRFKEYAELNTLPPDADACEYPPPTNRSSADLRLVKRSDTSR